MSQESRYRRLFTLGLGAGGGSRSDRELDEELDAHLEMRVRDLMARGLSREEAEAEAGRRFGDLSTARRQLRQGARRRNTARRSRLTVSAILADLRFAARQARRAPGVTAMALATLAIGIGAATATFSLVYGVLLRPLPFAEADRLVSMSSVDSVGNRIEVVASANWADWKRESQSLSSIAAHMWRRFPLRTPDGAIFVPGQLVSSAYFAVLRTPFLVGRSFTDDEAATSAPVAVVSETFWRRYLGADSTLSTPIVSGARQYRVVGVVPSAYVFPDSTQLFLPTVLRAGSGGMRNNINWSAIGRLHPGVSIGQAEAELTAIARGINSRDPGSLYSYGVGVRPLQDAVIRDAPKYLRFLMGAVVLLLVIACANLTAANLARALSRSREMAIRGSLGAGRGRLIQQVLIEHLMLGLIGGALGVATAWIIVRLILSAWASQIPRSETIGVDGGVLLFALTVSLIAGLVTGVVPAVRGARTPLSSLIAAGGRANVRGGRNLPGGVLVAGQIAMAVVLLIGAGLLLRSFRRLLEHDLGFTTSVVTVDAVLTGAYRDDTARSVAYWDALADTLASTPGVNAAGAAVWTPLGSGGTAFVEIDGSTNKTDGAAYRSVSHRYLDAIGVPLLAGRAFDSRDMPGGERVTLVNRAMAERYWPGLTPVGKRVRATSFEFGFDGSLAPWLTVIGVVGDVRHRGLEDPPSPEMYVLYRQFPRYVFGMSAVARTTGPPGQMVETLRRRARRVDPLVALDVETLEARLARKLAPRRLTLTLLSGFGGIALLLVGIGLYGVLSYSVVQRTREIAVRAALGAQRGRLMAMVFGGAMLVVMSGLAIGLAAAVASARLVEAMLVDVSRLDPLSYAVAALALFVTAVAAVAIPAYRATRLDPLIALRAE